MTSNNPKMDWWYSFYLNYGHNVTFNLDYTLSWFNDYFATHKKTDGSRADGFLPNVYIGWGHMANSWKGTPNVYFICWEQTEPSSEVSWQLNYSESEVAQSCPTLCDPMDCSLQGFSIHGIFQARIVEWVTISFSRGSSRPRDGTRVSHIGGRCFNLWATWKQLGFLPQEICNVIISVFSNPSSGPLFAWPGTDWDWIPQSHWLAPKGTYWICGLLPKGVASPWLDRRMHPRSNFYSWLHIFRASREACYFATP